MRNLKDLLLSHHPDCKVHFRDSTVRLFGVRICKGCLVMYLIALPMLGIYFFAYRWQGSLALFVASAVLYMLLNFRKAENRFMYGFLLAFAIADLYENTGSYFYYHLAFFLAVLLFFTAIRYRELTERISSCDTCNSYFK